ncbi:MAG: NAD(P)-dependent oxidoreductase [Deltaproteobacteria bacterium]|nr:NAD(P)-dependent oxidoreductase [Deltaproteobacteria bacterium]
MRVPIGSGGQTPALPGRVFVTGANGFIGRALMTRYRALGVDVRGVDVSGDAAWSVVAGDVGEAGGWQAHAAGCDLVINTVAVVSNTAPRPLYWRISVNGVRKALDAAVAGGAERFIQISSCAAFGKQFPPDADETYPVAAATGRAYDDAKGGSEHPALAAHAAGEIACTIVRPGDVYGPGSRPWVLLPLEVIRKGMFLLPAYGKGILSPTYIDDLVDGIVLAGGTSAAAGHIFSITGGVAVTCEEYFAHLCRWVKKSGRPRAYSTATVARLARIAGVLRRLTGQKSEAGPEALALLTKPATVSIAKARRVLGYEPKIDLAEGMRRTEAWLREKNLLPPESIGR